VEAKLREEFKRLKLKWQAGFEIELVYEPTDPIMRPRITLADGKKRMVNGEWVNGRITIYVNESLEKAIHTLHHEFIEYILCNDLVDPYVTMANALQNVFKTLTYQAQEKRIESLAKMEDVEYEKLKRNSVKH